MKRLPQWRPRLALLAGIWAAGGIGLATPPQYGDSLRAAIDDALRPGREAAATAAGFLQATLARFRSSDDDDELRRLQAEIEELRNRMLQQQADKAALIQQTSAESETAVDHPPLLTRNLVPAAVLGRQPDLLRTRFSRILNRGAGSQIAVQDLVLADAPHLDQGTEEGVQEHQPVLTGRIVVGAIGRAGRWTSTVQLVTDPEYRANVQLVRESRSGPVVGAAGVLRGNGGRTCLMEYVPKTAAVSVGDHVYSRRDGEEPSPLYYGRIIAAEIPAGSDDWRIEVEPAFNPASLNHVQILTVSLNPQRIGEQQALAPAKTDGTPALFPPPADAASQP